jgi:hypothetical protein
VSESSTGDSRQVVNELKAPTFVRVIARTVDPGVIDEADAVALVRSQNPALSYDVESAAGAANPADDAR